MKQETLVAAVEHVVHQFLVVLGAKCAGCQCLCLATSEYSRTVRTWQIVGPAGDGAYLVELAAVHAYSLIKNTAAHCVALHFVEVTGNHRGLFLALVFWDCLHEVVKGFLE